MEKESEQYKTNIIREHIMQMMNFQSFDYCFKFQNSIYIQKNLTCYHK